jgi:hypothetical protein
LILNFLRAYNFKYAREVSLVIEAHHKYFQRDLSIVALDIAIAINDYSEGVVKEAMRLYIKDYSKNHPNYFVGICKRFYREQGGSIDKKPGWGKAL